jgi:DNA-directed RNA polymerase specialized sigma24 family protein
MDSRAEAEFTEFMHGRWSRLVRLGYGLTGDLGLAEDLAQTALAKTFASWPRVRRAGDPDADFRGRLPLGTGQPVPGRRANERPEPRF